MKLKLFAGIILIGIIGSYQMIAQKQTTIENHSYPDRIKMSYADINGDGYPDKIQDLRIRGPKERIRTYIYLNDKNGSFKYTIYSENTMYKHSHPDKTDTTYKDMNNDGFADQIFDLRIRGPPERIKTYVLLNDGEGNFLK